MVGRVTKKGPESLEAHPFCAVFPEMTPAAYDALKADIREHGLREPEISVYEGKILDGRHRYRACTELGGIAYDLVAFEGDGCAAREFCVSQNLHRRHLDESQRAMVAARLANLPQGRPANKAANLPVYSQAEAGALVNVSERTVRSAKVVLDYGTPELIRAVDDGAIVVSLAAGLAPLPAEKQHEALAAVNGKPNRAVISVVRDFHRAERHADIRRQAGEWEPGTFDGPYAVIYADPPWKFAHRLGDSRAPEEHYDTLATDAVCSLQVYDRPVSELALPRAALFLWVPAALFYPDAMRVVEAWGFRYATHFVWVKDKIGIGWWVRNKHEDLVVAVRGDLPPPLSANRYASVIEAPRAEHSAKPPMVRDMVDAMYPDLPKIELFARGAEPDGWRFWGYEARSRAVG